MKTINEIYAEIHKKEETPSNSMNTSIGTTAIAHGIAKLVEEKIVEKIANDEGCILFDYPITIDQFNLTKGDVKQITKSVIDEICAAGYEDKRSYGLWDEGTCTINLRLLLYPLTDQDKKKMKRMDRAINIFDWILYVVFILTLILALGTVMSDFLPMIAKGFVLSFVFLLFWGGCDVILTEWMKSKCMKIAKKYVKNN